MKKYLKTTEIARSENYPYGRLRCVKTWAIDFKPGKGFRSIEQTIDPKSGRLNAPKKSTYSPVLVLVDNDGFISYSGVSFYGDDGVNKGCVWMAENFDLFTPEQIKHVYGYLLMTLKASVKAQVVYCGSKMEDVLPLFEPAIKTCAEGFKNGGNMFGSIVLDIAAIEAAKVPNYQPFKVSETFIIGANGMREVSL